MPVFDLSAYVTISVSTSIEADTLEEAIEKSKDLPVIHWSEAHGVEETVWIADDMDGSAQNIKPEG